MLNLYSSKPQAMYPKFNIIILAFLIIITTGFKNNSKSIETEIVKREYIYQENLEPKNLIGKWIMDGDPETYINLGENGIAVEKSLGEPLKRYWLVRDNKLCLKATSVEKKKEMCLDYELHEDELIIIMNDMKINYIRFRE